jgi:hypothetical protein
LPSVTAIELFAVVSALGVARVTAEPASGTSVGSFFSTLDDFSALDEDDELDDAGASEAGSGAIGAVDGTGDVALALAVRETGGGFIQSRTYGTATAPNTPRTIRTRTTRNHVAAKIERGGTSS